MTRRLIDMDILLKSMDKRYKEKEPIAPDNLAEGFMQMDKLIREQPVVNTWILCDKKLPDCLEPVLVIDSAGDTEIAYRTADGWFYRDRNKVPVHPIKWQPLPTDDAE